MADPTNVVGRRIGAYAIDLFLMVLLAAAAIIPIFLSALETAPAGTVDCGTNNSFNSDTTFDRSPGSSGPSFCFEDNNKVRYIPNDKEGSTTASFYGIALGIQALNLVVLQGLTGASLGKLMVGLRVIRQDGRKAGIGWAALRWVLLFVDSICLFLPGVIMVFVTKGHRRIGDMAASSFVVRKESVGTAPHVPGVTAPVNWPGGGQQGWVSPPTAQPGTWAPGGTDSAAYQGGPPNADGPTWDADRNAYIQYDHDRGAWGQWDDHAKTWGPIDQ